MCCFTGSVNMVGNTRIFARSVEGRQYLVYAMHYASDADVAMVLPLPVALNADEDAVSFINLEAYPRFFDDMAKGFEPPAPPAGVVLLAGSSRGVRTLRVHDVGGFEASFVPRPDDFDRLDSRFRLPGDIWDQRPVCRDYGFAVFTLKPAHSPMNVHPMALSFPQRDPARLFFPTVHVHDGAVHAEADFAHTLYCQPADPVTDRIFWQRSYRVAADFIDGERASSIVDAAAPCWRTELTGSLENVDTWLGANGTSRRPRPFVIPVRLTQLAPEERTLGIFTHQEVVIGTAPKCEARIEPVTGVFPCHVRLSRFRDMWSVRSFGTKDSYTAMAGQPLRGDAALPPTTTLQLGENVVIKVEVLEKAPL
jgi:hypothetical protein